MKRLLLMLLLWSGCGGDNALSQAPLLPESATTPTVSSVQTERVALVIGNARYERVRRLNCAANDAEDMARALEQVGFGKPLLITNANRKAMQDAIQQFVVQARNKTAVVYYSGHGVQIQHDNYLIPTDANPQDEADAKQQCLAVTYVLEKLAAAGCKKKILILDACRDNPFEYVKSLGKTIGSDASKSGLTVPQLPPNMEETFIAFATAPGKTVPDGTGRNSPYTEALLAEWFTPNQRLDDLFMKVRVRLVPQKIQPWENSALGSPFIVFPQVRTQETAAKPAPKPVAVESGKTPQEKIVESTKPDTQLSWFGRMLLSWYGRMFWGWVWASSLCSCVIIVITEGKLEFFRCLLFSASLCIIPALFISQIYPHTFGQLRLALPIIVLTCFEYAVLRMLGKMKSPVDMVNFLENHLRNL